MQSQVAKALRDVVMQLIRQQSQAAYGGDSPMQALKKALDELPQDSTEVTHPLKSRSTHLISANQTIQEALITAEQTRRRYSEYPDHYLLDQIASSSFFDFPTKRALLDLLLAASSETESQAEKTFAKLIDDALEDACGLSGQHEEQIMADITTNHEMIRALVERLLHAKEGRLREDDLRCYPEAFANAILELGVSMPSLEAAEAAVVAAAERWTGTSHTREEVTEFVHRGQMKIRSWISDAFNRAVESATAFPRVKNCPSKDIMDTLCQVPPASQKAHLLIDHLVLYSKPPPSEYCSMRKSCITLLKLYASSSTSLILHKHMHEADVEEFACFFAPMNSIDHGHDENASSSRIESSSPFPHQQGLPWPPSMEERVDEVLRDALVDTARRLEDMSSEGSSSYSNTTLLERLVCEISSSAPPTLKRELLRQVLHDSRTSPPESVVDEAFRRIITVSVERINRPSLIDLLQDAILHDNYSSMWDSSMKQALIERLVFVCKPLPAEFSGSQALADAFAVGIQRLREELSVERPLEEMAAAIMRLPWAKPPVKRVLLLAMAQSSSQEEEKKKEEIKKEEKIKGPKDKDDDGDDADNGDGDDYRDEYYDDYRGIQPCGLDFDAVYYGALDFKQKFRVREEKKKEKEKKPNEKRKEKEKGKKKRGRWTFLSFFSF